MTETTLRPSKLKKKKALPFGVVLSGSLVTLGMAWMFAAPAASGSGVASAGSDTTYTADQVLAGKTLFQATCASCHGLDGQGIVNQAPSIIGAGAAACDFQVSTGRMPLKVQAAQADRGPAAYSAEQIEQIDAYCASLAPGTAIPVVDTSEGDVANGGELFRANCAQCHNFAGAGGALAAGKYAPEIYPASDVQVAEAIRTGPESMPVFGPQQLSQQDVDSIIKYVQFLRDPKDPGGNPLGHLGPVPEGAIIWIVGIGGLMVGCLWIGGRNKA